MAVISTLTIDLIAKSATLTKDLRSASRSVEKFAKDSRAAVNTAGRAFVGLAAGGAASLAALTASSIDTNLELINLARVADESVSTFSVLATEAKRYGVEQDKLSDILKDTSDRVGDFLATGGGPMADFFENIAPKVGVTAEQFRGLSGSQGLQLYFDSLQKANVSQEEMVFYLEAMASDTTQLIPLLQKGSGGLGAMATEAQILGTALTDIQAVQLENMNESFTRAQQAASGFGTQLAVQVAPIIESISNEFLNAAREAGGMGEIASAAINAIATAAGIAGNAVRTLQIGFQFLGTFVTALTSTIINLADQALQSISGVISFITGGAVTAGSALSDLNNQFKSSFDVAAKDLEDLLLKPIPSQSIKEWVADVQSKSIEAAKEEVATQGAISDVLAGGGVGDGTTDTGPTPAETFREGLTSFQEVMQEYQLVAENSGLVIQDIFANTATSAINGMSQGIANAIVEGQALDEVMKNVGKSMLKEVLGGFIRLGAQMLINQALSEGVQAAVTAAAIASGATVAAAWAPAAAFVSLASFGSNAAPASAGIASTVGLANSLSIVGVAHSGIDEVPREGTWLLDKGERVLSPQQNKDLTEFLTQESSNDGGGSSMTIEMRPGFYDEVSLRELSEQLETVNPRRVSVRI